MRFVIKINHEMENMQIEATFIPAEILTKFSLACKTFQLILRSSRMDYLELKMNL